LRFVTVLALLRSDKTGTSNRTRPLCDASAREKIWIVEDPRPDIHI